MTKKGKDRKKKRKRSKESTSSSGPGETLLMGKQGLNAPRPTVTVASDEEGLPDLGHSLPNLDQVSPSQAWRDEKDWESLDRDLTQEHEEDLMTSRGQTSTCINRAEVGSEDDPDFATNYEGRRGQ
jgi:hypothetical protein